MITDNDVRCEQVSNQYVSIVWVCGVCCVHVVVKVQKGLRTTRTSERQPACVEERESLNFLEQSYFYTLITTPLSGVPIGSDGLLHSAGVKYCGSRQANSEAEGTGPSHPPP